MGALSAHGSSVGDPETRCGGSGWKGGPFGNAGPVCPGLQVRRAGTARLAEMQRSGFCLTRAG